MAMSSEAESGGSAVDGSLVRQKIGPYAGGDGARNPLPAPGLAPLAVQSGSVRLASLVTAPNV
jgi:hypothetical protein